MGPSGLGIKWVPCHMSPGLKTLDQLQGNDLPLGIILRLYPDADTFMRGVLSLITSGDVRLLTNEHVEVPSWHFESYSRMGR